MTKKLWGGRFRKKTDPLVEQFTRSIQYDYKLAICVHWSLFHVQVLKKCAYLSAGESNKLYKALMDISHSLDKDTFKYAKNSEDIHTDIQNILRKKLGMLALKLHMPDREMTKLHLQPSFTVSLPFLKNAAQLT